LPPLEKALDTCYKSITKDPTVYQIRKKNYRHAVLRKFRYRVVFALTRTRGGGVPSATHEPQA